MSDTDALAPRDARPLVDAGIVLLRKQLEAEPSLSETPGLLAALRRLNDRKEEFGTPAIKSGIAKLYRDYGSVDNDVAPVELEAVTSDESQREDDAPYDPLQEWLTTRAEVDPHARAERDVALLETFRGRPLPVSLAEAMYADDDVWTQAPLSVWIDQLDAPLDASISGVAAAALINSRLRMVRPRIFLRNPSSLVVQPIANSHEVDQMRNEIRSQFATRALGAVFDAKWVLDAEARRPQGIRKVEVEKVVRSIGGLFTRLGFDERPDPMTPVEFDPVIHAPIDSDIANQEVVLVKRPGLWDKTVREFARPPLVGRESTLRDEADSEEEGEA